MPSTTMNAASTETSDAAKRCLAIRNMSLSLPEPRLARRAYAVQVIGSRLTPRWKFDRR